MRWTLAGAAIIGRTIGVVLLAALALCATLYATAPLYRLDSPGRFEGSTWYNPYAALDTGQARWRQANFHAHSRAWGGSTDGRQSAQEVVAVYRRLGYDIVSLSNYHELPAALDTSVFPVFEHGWNVFKSHRLALGASRVVWRDYPLAQTIHHKQDLIRRLREADALVAIAHPALRNGHSISDFRRLSGYEALEVLNHFTAPAEAEWDAALSTGHAVWVLANDDSHDVSDTDETGLHWTLVHTTSTQPVDVLRAVRAGRTIGVRGVSGHTRLRFHGMNMDGDTLTLRVSGPIAYIDFFGQDGVRRLRHDPGSRRSLHDTIVARAVASTNDGYLRPVVVGVDTSAQPGVRHAMYLNPVIRTQGRAFTAAAPVVDLDATRRWRANLIGALLGTVVVLPLPRRVARALRDRRRRRRPAQAPVPA